MADNKDKEKKKSKTTKGDLILILVLALILALCVGAYFIVPDIVKGRHPIRKMITNVLVKEETEDEEELKNEPTIGVVGEMIESYETDGQESLNAPIEPENSGSE